MGLTGSLLTHQYLAGTTIYNVGQEHKQHTRSHALLSIRQARDAFHMTRTYGVRTKEISILYRRHVILLSEQLTHHIKNVSDIIPVHSSHKPPGS